MEPQNTTQVRATLETHGWLPLRGYADVSRPLSLALAGGFANQLETLTRGIWSRSQLNTYTGSVSSPKNDTREDETQDALQEVVSAVIKITRLTTLTSPIIPKTRKKRKGGSTDVPLAKKLRKEAEAEPTYIDIDSDEELPNKAEKIISLEVVTEPETEISEPASGALQTATEPETEISEPVSGALSFWDDSGIPEEEGECVCVQETGSEHRARLEPPETPTGTGNTTKETETCGSLKETETHGLLKAYGPLEDQETSGDELETAGFGVLSMSCPSLRAWNKRHHLWSRFDQGARMDETAWFEMTPEIYAKRIATRVSRALRAEEDGNGYLPVLAACCGVGGDAVALARFTPAKVVCVDISPAKVELARHNAGLYNVGHKMSFVTQDINEFSREQVARITHSTRTRTVEMPVKLGGKVLRTLTETVEEVHTHRPFQWTVMSPPWGGPGYRSSYSYSLSDQSFADLIKMVQSVMHISQNVCLILPRNQDVNELIHLASKGAADERFPYLEVEKLTEKKNGYPFLIAAYLCRSPCLFQTDHDPQKSVANVKETQNMIKLDSEKKPLVLHPRPALPSWDVAAKVIAEKKAKLGKDEHLSVSDLHNLIYCRFILVYLEEPPHQVVTTELALQMLGISNFLWLVEETVRVVRAGGLSKKEEGAGNRSNGGVFFDILRQCFPAVFKALRKWRKSNVNVWKESKKKKPGTKSSPK